MKNWKIYIGYALSAGLLAYLLSRINLHELVSHVTALPAWAIPTFIAIYLSGFLVRAVRSQLMLPALNLVDAFWTVVIGYAANNILPARLGEFVRSTIVSRRTGVSGATTLSSVFIERLFDGLIIVLYFLIGSTAVALPAWAVEVRNASSYVFFGGTAGFLVAVYTSSWWARRVGDLPFGGILLKFLAGGQLAARSLPVLAGILSLSALVWGIEGVLFWTAGNAFGFDLGVRGALFVLAAVNLGVLVPSSPGGIGLFQYVAVQSLLLFGVSESVGVAYGMVLHLCELLPIIVLGLLKLPSYGFRSMSEVQPEA